MIQRKLRAANIRPPRHHCLDYSRGLRIGGGSLLLPLLLLSVFALHGSAAFAQAETRRRQPPRQQPPPRITAPRAAAAPIAAETFTLETGPAEVGLEIRARSTGASWARKGAEAAALLIEVDGQYNQDLLLWAGDEYFTYRVMLGRLPRGKHTITVTLNAARSAEGAQRAEVSSLRARPAHQLSAAGRDDGGGGAPLESLAVAHSPILYARANSFDHFTDVPLMMYYEIERGAGDEAIVRYTVIFSHEDGGTPAVALMARWGRTTDIEWVYEILVRGGKIVRETYQGVRHETKTFSGRRALGSHPLLAVASDNNNFSDLACSIVRFAPLPVRADLGGASREVMMDTHSWMYRIMAEELGREERISDDGATSDPHLIADPRNYLYIEAFAEQKGTAVGVDAAIAGAPPQLYSSDKGDARLRIERSGSFRTTIRLPAAQSSASVSSLIVRCHPSSEPADARACRNVKLNRVFALDRQYVPRSLTLTPQAPATLAPGETLVYSLTR